MRWMCMLQTVYLAIPYKNLLTFVRVIWAMCNNNSRYHILVSYWEKNQTIHGAYILPNQVSLQV